MAEAFPLAWPAGYPRSKEPQRSPFKITRERGIRILMNELKLLGAPDWNVILSTNVPLRRDGRLFGDTAEPRDAGVAVYFRIASKGDAQMVLACDRWHRVGDNIRALGMTVEAMRGMERWGCSDMLNRAFTGFVALPAPAPEPEPPKHWSDVLGVFAEGDLAFIEDAYKFKLKSAHPDLGGSHAETIKLNLAIEQARLEKGRP